MLDTFTSTYLHEELHLHVSNFSKVLLCYSCPLVLFSFVYFRFSFASVLLDLSCMLAYSGTPYVCFFKLARSPHAVCSSPQRAALIEMQASAT